MFKNKKAQSALEYTVLIVCVVAALLGMQHYIKRATQGRLRDVADSIGDQYDAQNIDAQVTLTQSGTTITESTRTSEAIGGAESGRVFGVETVSNTDGESSTRSGHEDLGAYSGSLF